MTVAATRRSNSQTPRVFNLLKASAAEMGENLHTSTVAWIFHQSKLCVANRTPLLKKAHFKSQLEACGTLQGQRGGEYSL